ncbi:MAG: AMP-binding protein [Pseudomonadota bacterium]
MDAGMMTREIDADKERYPILTGQGRSMLAFLREHPHAPIFRNRSGHKLTAEDLVQVMEFEEKILGAKVGWDPSAAPGWVGDFVRRCLDGVPHYRRYGGLPGKFEDLPLTSRADLARDITAFIPDSVPIGRMINFRTSGTTGHPLQIPSHPRVAAGYLAFHKRALRRFGVELRNRGGRVGVVLLGFQRRCFTYVSVTPAMGESGLAKINLHPDDWRDPADRAKYLDALEPEVYSGDPISFAVLADLPLSTRPRALISTSMALTPGLRRRLEERFGCPVLDVYSMNEAGPLAMFDPGTGGHVLLQPQMYVEILDPAGRPVPPGTRGEITLTGGFNFYLPLLRYRTGDHASIGYAGEAPALEGLAGRPPVLFRTRAGELINNIEVTHVLERFALPRFALRQGGDGGLVMKTDGVPARQREIAAALVELFGPGQVVEFEAFGGEEGKVIQYVSETGAGPS